MEVKAKYLQGVFKPLNKINGINEGEELILHIETEDLHRALMESRSFDFLFEEENLYSEKDIKQKI